MKESSKKKKVCWIQHASEWTLVIPVAKQLRQAGIEVVFVCKTRLVHEKYLNEGFESHYVSDFFTEGKTYSNAELGDFDKNYGPPYISEIMNSDVLSKFFYGDDHFSYNQLIARTYTFWEEFADKENIDCFIARESATFLTRTAYNVAKKKEIRFAQFAIGPNENHFTLDDVNEEHVWEDFIDAIKNGPHNLKDEEKKCVDRLVKDYTDEMKSGVPLRYVPDSLFKSIKSIISLGLVDTKKNRKNEPILVGSSKNGIHNFVKRIEWAWFTKTRFKYDQLADEPYVYFPFYSGNETSYLSRNHYWGINQLSLIKEVAASLPHGYSLYVKEHPVNPGYFSYRELRSLQKISNVKVLEPSIHSWDLIQKCSFVFVLQGTVGWEALLVKKPVVSLGRPFFSYSSFVHNLEDISDLSKVVSKAITMGTQDYEEKIEEWYWFIHTVFSTSGNGISVLFKPPYGFPDDKNNAEKIATYIKDWVYKHEKKESY